MPDTPVTPDMTLLDTVRIHPGTQAVFHARDELAGECLLCSALFKTIREAADQYGLDLAQLLRDLEQAAKAESPVQGCASKKTG